MVRAEKSGTNATLVPKHGFVVDAVDDGSVVMASEFGDLGLGNLGAGSEVEPDRLHGGSEHLRTEAVDVDAAESEPLAFERVDEVC